MLIGLSTTHCTCQVMPCQWGKIDLDSVFGKASQSLVAHLNVEGQHRGAVAAARANAEKHAHTKEHDHGHEKMHEHEHAHSHGASSADSLHHTFLALTTLTAALQHWMLHGHRVHLTGLLALDTLRRMPTCEHCTSHG